MSFYQNYEMLCAERGVSPTKAARDVGLAQPIVSQWKKRGSTPKVETVQKLAHYFGVSVEYLLGTGPRISPIFSSRRIFSAMNEKEISLEKMSQLTAIPIETIRSFALGEKVENGRNCLEKIARVLEANPAYLMGWTNHPDDDSAYWNISENIWGECNNDPDSAHGAQQALELDSIGHEGTLVYDLLERAKQRTPSRPWAFSLIEKLGSVGYSIGTYEEDAYLWINYPDGTLEVTEEELRELDQSTDSFIRFKLQELRDRHPYRFRPKQGHQEQAPQSTPAPQEGTDTTPPVDGPQEPPEGK